MLNLVVASRNKSITNQAPSPYILCRIQFVPENSHLGYKVHSMKRHVHWQFVNSIWQTQGSWWKFERALFKLSWSVIKTFLHRIIQGNTDQWWNLETRAVARGGSDVRPPYLISVPPISRLGPRLLHTYITVFWKCVPPSGLWPPLLQNPGGGPARHLVSVSSRDPFLRVPVSVSR